MRRLLFLLLAFLFPLSLAQLELHFIDVGQGDSVLILSPSGQAVLYDGGRSPQPVLEYLEGLGIEELDLVIASHPDADHIGGLDEVVQRYRPRFYMDNGVPHTTQAYRRLLEAVQEAESQLLEPTGQRIGLGDASLQILPPPSNPSFDNNNRSVGVIISYGDFQAALTGDAEAEAFNWWVENIPNLLEPVEVYKAAHHGSDNGDTPLSMNTFKPEVVVISVGKDNTYGHPTDSALRLYRTVGAEVYRTDLQGFIRPPAKVKLQAPGRSYREQR